MTIPLKQILVNPQNPRFEPVKTEREAINLMLDEEGDKVFNLAKDIAQHGLNPMKNIMVVALGGGRFVPVDGNRRVIALKLLQDPSVTDDAGFVEKFQQLKKDSGVPVRSEIDCVLSPDSESAFRWVNLEHTGENKGVGVLDWDSVQRERFIAQYTGRKLSRAVQIIDYARENELLHGKIDSTTLDRLLGSPVIRKEIGVDFPDGILKIMRSQSEVFGNISKILSAMCGKGFKVAEVYDVEKATAWVTNILKGEEDQGKAKPEEEEQPGKKKKTRSKSDPFEGNWITSQLHLAYPANNRVKSMLGELKGLNPSTRPNVCATSLRVLLELAVYVYLDENGGIEDIVDGKRSKLEEDNRRLQTKRQWDKTWSPSFHDTLNYLCSHETLMKSSTDRKAVKVFIGKTSGEPFLAELNLFTHNPSYAATKESVCEIWCKLGKLIFKCILSGNNEDRPTK
jgi:hypothetical protein